TGKPISPLLVHEHVVVSAAFSPQGDRVVTGSADGTARVWDVRTGKPLTSPMRHRAQVAWCRFSPDGRCIVTFTTGGVQPRAAQVWDSVTGQPLTPPLEHYRTFESSDLSETNYPKLVSRNADRLLLVRPD